MKSGKYDVVVVGGGPGGLAAAAGAAENGARVVLLEATDALGGNAQLSTGYLVMIDTPLQREHSAYDSVDIFMSDGEKQFALEAGKGGLIWDRALSFPIERPKSVTTELVKKWLKGEDEIWGE